MTDETKRGRPPKEKLVPGKIKDAELEDGVETPIKQELNEKETIDCYTMEDRGPWVTVHSGAKVHLLTPTEDEILMSDIAHSLSNVCRFVGHTRVFYSVAEHSLRVAELCSDENKVWALLHDAAETYTGDISRPLKAAIPEIRDIESNMLKVIATKFDLPWPIPQEVKDADEQMLATEAVNFLTKTEEWVPYLKQEPLKAKISTPMLPEQVKYAFLEKFKEYSRHTQ